MEEKKKVMLIDDDVEFVNKFSEKLQTAGLEVVSSLSGKDALDYLSHHDDVDFIVLDFIMPEMDGYSFYKKLRTDFKKNIPAIVLTNLSGSEANSNLEVYEKLQTDLDVLAASIKNRLASNTSDPS
jgi:CheY-like chemotaxis protein